MTDLVPHGYISVREAVDRLGRELFPEAWTGEEHDARSGLISEEEWLKIKDLPPPRGGGATGGAPFRTACACWKGCTAQGQSPPRLRPHRIGPVILPTLRTRKSTGPVNDTRMHANGFAPSLKPANSKQPS